MTTGLPIASPLASPRPRGKSGQANWRRPDEVAVIALDLDLSADPVMRRRVEKHWEAVFLLRRALQRDAGALCRAYLAARNERAAVGARAVRVRLGLDRKGIEVRAKTHVERSGWMRRHFTKATALHVADEVWESCDRFLFRDSAGQRHGIPQVGSWWDLRHIPGRARSHTKARPVWETYRLVGSLQGHLGAYGAQPGMTVAGANAAEPGQPVFAQSGHLPAPVPPEGSWRAHDGALAVVYTGLPGGDLVIPVRLPQGAGQFARLAHFLGGPRSWHKVDLVRVRDRRAPGGWRYQAHLTVLGAGWVGPATAARRAAAPAGRLGGVDGNVSNLAVASVPAAGAEGELLTTHIRITGEKRTVMDREAKKARGRNRAMQRSRRAANAAQYQLGRKQQARADRRQAAFLPEREVRVPCGARAANAAGIPKQAYRRDTLSKAYRAVRADHAAAASASAHRRDDWARQAAQAIVLTHGPNLLTEDVDIRPWSLRWGRGIAAFTPGRLLARLSRECSAAGGALTKASTWTTALSQHCLCGRRAKKPLAQRWHSCSCGIEGDRDIVSAILAATVRLADPGDPKTAGIDHGLREHARRLVLTGHVLATDTAAQQEGPARSTVHHNPATGTGEDGSHPVVASAGQGERPAQPRHRPHGHPWGRRRNGGISSTPPIRKLELRINS